MGYVLPQKSSFRSKMTTQLKINKENTLIVKCMRYVMPLLMLRAIRISILMHIFFIFYDTALNHISSVSNYHKQTLTCATPIKSANRGCPRYKSNKKVEIMRKVASTKTASGVFKRGFSAFPL